MTAQFLWLVTGLLLCAIEALFPTAFVALVMGISALLVAIVAPWISLNLQILLWLVGSLLGIWASRRFIRASPEVQWDDREATTLTEILPGQMGRVFYEGNSWAARCEDVEATIPSKHMVVVVGRRGTTLLVRLDRSLQP
ncbi:MAG: NfeD family protein [Synechococcales bacterium]|nr:NfeD family protein [Synechococcales bacterium]